MVNLEADSLESMMSWVLSLRSSCFMKHNISSDDFDFISVLGRGYYGKVSLVQSKKTKEYYALKSIKKCRLAKMKKLETVINEKNILRKIQHPFIVSMKFTYQTASKFYIGMEYIAGGDLFFHLKNGGTFSIEKVRLYISEISLAIQYLHENDIIYRDIKPENILLDEEGHIKLTDFGLSKELKNDEEEECNSFCGTPDYYAPEIVLHQKYGKAIDWWSIGILTYELLFRKTPFHSKNEDKLFKNILKYSPEFPEGTSQDVIDFISMLLEKDPNKRAGFDEVNCHPFFNGLNFSDVYMRRIKADFVPKVMSKSDSTNFEKQFTEENPSDSFVAPYMGSLSNVSDFSCNLIFSESSVSEPSRLEP